MIHSTLARAILFGAALFTAAATPAAAQVAANGDIILHAQRATVMSGSWGLVSDSTAAGGLRLANPDAGKPKLGTALASPGDYFELKFTPQAGRAYRLWIRGKAQNNAWTNDSVFVQFSGSQNYAGSAVNRIGTTSATVYSLEEDGGAGVSEWGWQDNGYGYNVLGEPLYFSGAAETIRVQAREDGISIDQIVLSPVTYATAAPGAAKNDATILPEPGGTVTAAAPRRLGVGRQRRRLRADAQEVWRLRRMRRRRRRHSGTAARRLVGIVHGWSRAAAGGGTQQRQQRQHQLRAPLRLQLQRHQHLRDS